LEGLAIEELSEIDTNPLATPSPGLDNGHHGVDLAYYRRGSRTTMRGLPIYSVLTGRVAAAISDRPPYGNMVIIETPLDNISPSILSALHLPEVAPTALPAPAMAVCPTASVSQPWTAGDQRSLYFLYAHMDTPPEVKSGQQVTCGQPLGGVGTSGSTAGIPIVNEHLHLEARIGPSGAAFNGMAFYNTGASGEEMSNYCQWRISNTFQILNPLDILLALKNH
jgi:murein DD-endopeptidase MepM/ murein hydrolase activator NlpD